MSKITIHSYQELEEYVGKELGVSDYLTITQEQINKFADATLDYQWIHVDAEKAKQESPYKNTIAHGYLNLSILPYLWGQIMEIRNSKMTLNYGIERVRFQQAVVVNDQVRARAKLKSVVNLKGIAKAEIHTVLEIKNSNKPALEGTFIFLYHFE